MGVPHKDADSVTMPTHTPDKYVFSLLFISMFQFSSTKFVQSI